MDLRLALDDGFSKGGIKGRRDFRVHLSFAMQRRNQVEKQGRLAPVQLMTGMKVRTVASLSLAQGEVQIPKDLCEDMAFVERLEELVKDFTNSISSHTSFGICASPCASDSDATVRTFIPVISCTGASLPCFSTWFRFCIVKLRCTLKSLLPLIPPFENPSSSASLESTCDLYTIATFPFALGALFSWSFIPTNCRRHSITSEAKPECGSDSSSFGTSK